MRKISFHVEKGGTGKTTLAGNVAYQISRGARVIAIDGDPQGNLTSWYLRDSELQFELADVMQKKCGASEAITEVRPGLSLLGTFGIDGELKEWSETQLAGKPFAFEDLCEDLETMGFEFAIFDLGPGISILERSILAVMSEVIAVVSAEYFSADGIEIFENELEKLRRDRRAKFKVEKMVINRMHGNYSLHRAYHDVLAGRDYRIFTVHQSTAISDCVPEHMTVFEYDPRNPNLPELRKLAESIQGDQDGTKEK